jgi:hypothetical protein
MNSSAVLYGPGNNDECFTPDYGVVPLLEFLEPFRGQIIWCPFDEVDSAFVRILSSAGHTVIRSHINNNQDFYTYEPDEWDIIVSNPPFTNKRKIFERALSFGKSFALLMSNTWLNDAAPKQLFEDVDLQLLMFDLRIEFVGQAGKITFSSSYYCRDLLPKQLIMRKLVKPKKVKA